MAQFKNDMQRIGGQKIAITVSPRVAEQLLSTEKAPLDALGEELGREIEIRARAGLHEEQFEVESLEPGPAADFAPAWLRDPAEIAAEEKAERERRNEGKSSGNGRRRNRGRGRGRDQASTDKAEEAETADNDANQIDEPASDTPQTHAGEPETPTPAAKSEEVADPQGGSGESAAGPADRSIVLEAAPEGGATDSETLDKEVGTPVT